jgi:hypothetical protein
VEEVEEDGDEAGAEDATIASSLAERAGTRSTRTSWVEAMARWSSRSAARVALHTHRTMATTVGSCATVKGAQMVAT